MSKIMEILIGIPGVGKSTYSREAMKKGAARVNKDDIRKTLPKNQKESVVIAAQDNEIKVLAMQGVEHIIVDNTHMNKFHWSHLTKLGCSLGYEVQFKWFDESLDADLCHKRNLMQGRDSVPWAVIEQMYAQYFGHWMEREGHVVDLESDGKKAIIVDLDGTVAHNDGHRGWYEWEKVHLDLCHNDIHELVVLLHQQGYHVIFLSGRDSACRQQTVNWIDYHFSDFIGDEWSLFMRPKDDMRKDCFVKFELFMNHVNGIYNVRYVLDDRWQVVRMWRAMGLRCLSVDNGFK